jgi:hypothetical protein
VKPPRHSELNINGYPALQAVAWNSSGTGLYVVCSDEDDSSTLHVSLKGEVTLLRHQPMRVAAWAKPSADGNYLMLADSSKASNVWLLQAGKTFPGMPH